MAHDPDHHHARHGARQPERFDPARAAMLDDPARLAYLPAQRILDLLDVPAGGTVLDFGAGTGFYVDALLRLRPDLRVIAVDEQDAMLALLRERARGGRFVVGGPEIVDDVAGTVDRVLAINVLHEIGDDDLRHLVQRLGPRATFLFIDWDAAVTDRPGPPADHVYRAAEAATRLATLGLASEPPVQLTYHYALRARTHERPGREDA